MRKATVNPVLIRQFRGDEIETVHRGAYCIFQDGRMIDSVGDIDAPCFVRSGAKFFQALPVLESGAEKLFGLGDEDLALMCASHGGEEQHVRVAGSLLARGGLNETDLACGAHSPLYAPASLELQKRGEKPRALHNNCSGKHAGMLLGCLAAGVPREGYLRMDHPWQIRIHHQIAELAGVSPEDIGVAIDGCSAPTFFLSLRLSARAFSEFARRVARPTTREGQNAARLWDAVARQPFMIGGTDRFCTRLAEISGGRVVSKIGADGFYAAMSRTTGTGVVLHVDDGIWNMSERLLTAVLVRHGLISNDEKNALARWNSATRKNWAGLTVGHVEINLP